MCHHRQRPGRRAWEGGGRSCSATAAATAARAPARPGYSAPRLCAASRAPGLGGAVAAPRPDPGSASVQPGPRHSAPQPRAPAPARKAQRRERSAPPRAPPRLRSSSRLRPGPPLARPRGASCCRRPLRSSAPPLERPGGGAGPEEAQAQARAGRRVACLSHCQRRSLRKGHWIQLADLWVATGLSRAYEWVALLGIGPGFGSPSFFTFSGYGSLCYLRSLSPTGIRRL
jgi:hypothetical protein